MKSKYIDMAFTAFSWALSIAILVLTLVFSGVIMRFGAAVEEDFYLENEKEFIQESLSH